MFNSAETCRARGWGPGTRLIGDEGYGPTVIRITALGERRILAVAESHNGIPYGPWDEAPWTLEHRDWRVCESTESEPSA